jgi:hypothetical protein
MLSPIHESVAEDYLADLVWALGAVGGPAGVEARYA